MFESLKAKMKSLFSKAEKKLDKDKVYKDGPELPGPGPDKKDEPKTDTQKTVPIEPPEAPAEPPKTGTVPETEKVPEVKTEPVKEPEKPEQHKHSWFQRDRREEPPKTPSEPPKTGTVPETEKVPEVKTEPTEKTEKKEIPSEPKAEEPEAPKKLSRKEELKLKKQQGKSGKGSKLLSDDFLAKKNQRGSSRRDPRGARDHPSRSGCGLSRRGEDQGRSQGKPRRQEI